MNGPQFFEVFVIDFKRIEAPDAHLIEVGVKAVRMHFYVDLFTPDLLPLPPCELLVIVDDSGQSPISFSAGLIPPRRVRFSFGFFVNFSKTSGPVNVDTRPIGMEQPVQLLDPTSASHLG
jgi:hypothetical protein